MKQGKAIPPSTLKGNIFNIQRYSIHDGRGIRTLVFLKDVLSIVFGAPILNLNHLTMKLLFCKTAVSDARNVLEVVR